MNANPATTEPARQSVLLIGGTGYVGDAMRPRLRDAGYTVRLLVRDAGQATRYGAEGYATAVGEVADVESLARAMQRVDAVINLVAIIREHGQATFERVNYQGSVNVVDAVRRAGLRRLIQMSALGAGNLPDYPYHYTKWRAENYVKDSGLDWTIFRPSIVFGPGEQYQFVTALADVVRKAPLIPVVGDGSSRFQPIHHDDVADCFSLALRDSATIGQTYEIAGPEVVTYEQILDECARALGKHKRKLHVPVALMTPAVALLEALPFVEAPVTREQLKMLKLDNTTQHNAAPALLGHAPQPFLGQLGYIADDGRAPR
jgi:NADH dehydrogenase